jgi:hypothetical protein
MADLRDSHKDGAREPLLANGDGMGAPAHNGQHSAFANSASAAAIDDDAIVQSTRPLTLWPLVVLVFFEAS